MFVEVIYGFISNSLGLITDGVHMFFDCSALVLALLASYMASFPANESFNYGYGRIEVLSGLTNCVFLIFVACSIVLESVQRLMRPQQVIGDQLIVVSVLGLLVNLVGVVLLQNQDEGNNDPPATPSNEEQVSLKM
jgi:zinc transporter 5/7